MNKFLKLAASIAVMGTSATFSTASRAAVDYMNFQLPQLYAAYGDGFSFGLAVSCSQFGFQNNSSCPWYVESSPGQIDQLTVGATGASGVPITTNFANMDNAYSTPSGRSGSTFFRTGGLTYLGTAYPETDPGGAGQFTGDRADSWDARLDAFQNYLGQSKAPVFFFNNNQTNSGGASNQTLAIWAKVWITGPGDTVLGVFDFTNNMGDYRSAPDGGGVVFGDPTAYTSTGLTGVNANPRADATGTDYVLAGGQNCLTAGTPLTGGGMLVSCDDPLADRTINNNLGANQAAYAVVFPELSALMAQLNALSNLPVGDPNRINLSDYALHADFRMGCDPTLTFSGDSLFAGATAGCTGKDLNSGYEQIFIGAYRTPGNQTPEPETLALLGLAIAGIGFARRSIRKQH